MAELPFLKNAQKKNQGGGGPSMSVKAAPTHENNMDNDLMDQVVDELFQAIETKNKQLLRQSLEALVLHIQDMDEQQDQEEDSE
jgi:hypothetical protein